MSIHTFGQKIKGVFGGGNKGFLLVLIMALLAGASFYLGYMAHKETMGGNGSPVLIECPDEAYMPSISGEADNAGVSLPGASFGAYVASRNGTKYYPKDCSGVSRINEANKVWFNSEQEAQNAGLSRASGCVWP